MSRLVVLEIVTYISEENIASIFRVGTLIMEAALSTFQLSQTIYTLPEKNVNCLRTMCRCCLTFNTFCI